MSRIAVIVVAVLALLGSAGRAASAQNSKPVNEQTVYEIAAHLRCVVCQSLSVADSPSEMATQMRAIIRERLAAGASPAALPRSFVRPLTCWDPPAPPRPGFHLLVLCP